jgi:hypothetical protein
MPPAAPLVRASYAKTVIATMKQRPELQRDALLAGLDNGLRREIREQGMFDWIAASQFAALTRVVLDALGPLGAKAFWHSNLLGSLERALLSPLRLGAIAVYGNSPGSLLRMTPQAWQLVSRNCGTCQTSDQPPAGIVLRFEELPAVLCNPAMLLLWSGGSESCIERMRFSGSAEAALDPNVAGVAEVRVVWRER